MKKYRPNDRQIAEQAAEWQQLLATGGPREREAFADWLMESRRHVRNYLLMAAFARRLEKIDPQRRRDVDALLADAATDVISLQTGACASEPRPWGSRSSHKVHRWRWATAIAANVAFIALTLQWISLPFMGTPIHETTTGEQQTLKLEDGSVVYLNAQSRLRVDFTDQRRDVRLLTGEALFVVERDLKRPFNVLVGSSIVQAIGTQFNVRRTSRDTLVSVVEGRVRLDAERDTGRSSLPHFARPSSAVPDNILTAGEEARIADDGQIRKQASADVERRVAWRQRVLEFREDSLATVIAEFNRYNRAPRFRLDSDTLSTRQYSGVFKADDPESLAQLLAQQGDIVLEKKDQEIVIRQRAPGDLSAR